MRSDSQILQHSISRSARTRVRGLRRIGAATVLIAATFFCGPPALAGVETLEDQGRRTQTGPKEVQIVVNGFPYDSEDPAPTPSGYLLLEQGRLLHARPTQRVSVGLMGCPGCGWNLGILDGIYFGFTERVYDHPHRSRSHTRRAPRAHRRPRDQTRKSGRHR